MANQNGGISPVAVAIATVGGILVYAGFRGVNPLQALREIGSGNPAAVSATSTDLGSYQSAGEAVGGALGNLAGGAFAAAAQKYMGDQYSQIKRRQVGWSDCSSFCDKVFRDVGIKPPFSDWANTANYRMSPEWRTIPASQSKPGDIAISSGHMVLVTGAAGSAAIGQQNTKSDVRTGTVANLMGGQSYVYKTYVGKVRTGLGGKTVGV